MKKTEHFDYTHINITPKRGNLEEIIDPASEYSRTVGEEMKLALAAPYMKVCLEDVRDWIETGLVKGVYYDRTSVLASIDVLLEELK